MIIHSYVFAEKKGFTQNLEATQEMVNADGTFVYTGFKPAWVMTKMTNGAKSWQIYDNKRFPSNPINAYLTLNADTNAQKIWNSINRFFE